MRDKAVLLALGLIGLLMCVAGCGCGEAMEETNRRLESLERRLKSNNHDRDALDSLLRELKNGCDGIARTNAAVTLRNVYGDPGVPVPSVVVDSLATALDTDKEAGRAIALTFSELGSRARNASGALIRAVETQGDSDTAWFSAEALGRMKAPEAVEPLTRALHSATGPYRGGADIRSFAARALGAIGPAAKSAVPNLHALLNESDPFLRIEIAIALIRIEGGDSRGLQVLRELIVSPEESVRSKLLFSLYEINLEAAPASSVLEIALSDRNPELREEAKKILEAIRSGSPLPPVR